MSFTPELVRIYNLGGVSREVKPMAEIEFQVLGMKCEACANKLKYELEKLPEIEEASVDFQSGLVVTRITTETSSGPLSYRDLGSYAQRIVWKVREAGRDSYGGYDAKILRQELPPTY